MQNACITKSFSKTWIWRENAQRKNIRTEVSLFKKNHRSDNVESSQNTLYIDGYRLFNSLLNRFRKLKIRILAAGSWTFVSKTPVQKLSQSAETSSLEHQKQYIIINQGFWLPLCTLENAKRHRKEEYFSGSAQSTSVLLVSSSDTSLADNFFHYPINFLARRKRNFTQSLS